VCAGALGWRAAGPAKRLVRREGTESVFVVRGDRAELVPIQTGVETAESPRSRLGPEPERPVVVSGAGTLKAGDRVQVKG